MSKHTPGPWKNHGRDVNAYGLPHSRVAAKTLLARVYSEAYGDIEQETANARLIAAAPELLQALRDMMNTLTDGPDQSDIDRVWSKARAAIAKATGGAA